MITFLFTSCNKQYTCSCVEKDVFEEVVNSFNEIIVESTKASAESECEQREWFYDNLSEYSFNYTSCEIN